MNMFEVEEGNELKHKVSSPYDRYPNVPNEYTDEEVIDRMQNSNDAALTNVESRWGKCDAREELISILNTIQGLKRALWNNYKDTPGHKAKIHVEAATAMDFRNMQDYIAHRDILKQIYELKLHGRELLERCHFPITEFYELMFGKPRSRQHKKVLRILAILNA